MNILINACSARRGGGQTYLINLLEHLDSLKFDKVFVVVPPSLALPQDVRVQRVNVKWPIENPFMRTIWERTMLPILVRKHKIDVVFCPGGVLNGRLKRACRRVIMFRNMLPLDRAQWGKYSLGWERIRLHILERVILKSIESADLIIFISEFAQDVVKRRIPLKPERTAIIKHGINKRFRLTNTANYERASWLPREEYLLYVSTFDVYKHHLEVLKAFRILKDSSERNEKLVFVGFNSNAYGEAVRKEIVKQHLESEVIMPGQVPYQDLPGVYRNAKVCLFASDCENCPNILLESMASGRAVLSSNRQPMPEFGGDSLVYFDPSNPEELASELLKIIDDPHKLTKLGQDAELQSNKFNWAVSASQTWEKLWLVANEVRLDYRNAQTSSA